MYYVIFGLPGSGKTTYAFNKAQNKDIIYDLDLLADAMAKTRNSNCVYVANAFLDTFLSCGETIENDKYIIRTAPTQDEMKIFDTYKAKYVYINASISLCKQRRKLSEERWSILQNRIQEIVTKENVNQIYVNEERW